MRACMCLWMCTRVCKQDMVLKQDPFGKYILSRTEEPEKAGTCARGRRALQQLALNVKHSDLT